MSNKYGSSLEADVSCFSFGFLEVFSLDLNQIKGCADLGPFHHQKETQNTKLNARTTYNHKYLNRSMKSWLEEVL